MIRVATIIFGIIALFTALIFPYIVDLDGRRHFNHHHFCTYYLICTDQQKCFCLSKVALFSILKAFMINLILFTYGTLYPEQFQAKTSFVPAFVVGTLVLVIGVLLSKPKKLMHEP